MAECKVRLIEEDDHLNDEKAFIGGKHYPRYGSSNHSDATPLDIHPEFYVQHHVTEADTLNSVALKYGVKASTVKITNRLWNDNIFLCKHLLIPVSNISDYENKNYIIISKKDIIKGISKSKSVGYFETQKNNFLTQHTSYNPDFAEAKAHDEETLDNVDCMKSNDINQVSAQDYFKKFDSSLAKIKKNVEKLEKQSRSPSKTKATSRGHPSSWHICNQDDQPSDTLFYRSSGNNCERRIREKFEKIENEMFQL